MTRKSALTLGRTASGRAATRSRSFGMRPPIATLPVIARPEDST